MAGSALSHLPSPPEDGHDLRRRRAASAHLGAVAAEVGGPAGDIDLELPEREAIRAAIGRIYERLAAVDLGALPDNGVREEIGRLVALVPDLPHLRDQFVVYEAEVAAASLATDGGSSDPTFARLIRQDLERRLSKARTDRANPAVWLVGGLVGVVFILPAIALWVLSQVEPGGLFATWGNVLAGFHPVTWLVIALAGSLGGAVSVLQRIATFKEVRGDRLVLVITGFSKPLIGAAFAMFVFALVAGDIIPLNLSIPAGSTLSPLHLALAFLAGFSERFVPDLTGSLERTYVTKVKVS